MKRLISFLFLLSVIFLAACGDPNPAADVIPTVEVAREVPTPTPQVVTSAPPTASIVATQIPVGVTPVAEAATPEPTATVVPGTTEANLVKPGMPEFVVDATVCGGANLDATEYVGKEGTEFTSVSYLPTFDRMYDTVVYFVPAQDLYMNFMAWQGDNWAFSNANRTYIIVRFDRSNDCSTDVLLTWAEEHLGDAETWATAFTEWHTQSLSYDDPAGTNVIDDVTVPAINEECRWDESPNAFIIRGGGPGEVNIVDTNPIFGEVSIESTDQMIEVLAGHDVVDGCFRRYFNVTQYSGAMSLFITASDGQPLVNHNAFAPFDYWGNQYDAP